MEEGKLTSDSETGGDRKRGRSDGGSNKLVDMGFIGFKFTWMTKRGIGEDILERLDRALCSMDWRIHFTEGFGRHLPRVMLDHCPILIQLHSNHIPTNICKPFSKRPSQYLSTLEETLVKEYQDILEQEEIFWQQKSRNCWLKEGDRNTKFFHLSAIIRRRRNKIKGFKKDDGSWIEDIGELKAEAVRNFLKLFKKKHTVGRQIQDNMVIAQEVLHKFKNMKGNMGYIAWKIDLAKAYDRLQ
ncbi:hypothetical protein Dsin_001100 [Dipteronia sinensis]|uniref:Reverse transcriptase n=1 Tax=Dipteronia sinensis TaxID=43782 RepID=A0AAE0B4X8_9ROSI|nr:hypothetical protein Dsin_001100 [Dipteronia sinensis]